MDRPDETALVRLAQDAQRFQSDTERFLELLTEDYVVVNIVGRRVKGRDAARRAMTAALESPLADVRTRHEVEDVTFLRPDVALISCIKHVSDERGGALDGLPARARLTFVAVHESGAWRIALAQTTPIVDAA